MHQKIHLRFSAMRKKMAKRFMQIEDSRQAVKVDYSVHDCLMSAFAMMKIIIVGDGLYSKQPFIDGVKQARMSFLLVAKRSDHKILFEWVDDLFHP